MPGHFSNTHRPKLGEKVAASAKLVKTHQQVKGKDFKLTVWERREQPVEGIYIGLRSVYDGGWEYPPITEYSDSDEPYFASSATHIVWLIVQNERTNPIRVAPEDVIGVGSHFPDDWRYFKEGDGNGCGMIRAKESDHLHPAPNLERDIQTHFIAHGWTEITYLEHAALENAAERGDVR